MRKVILGSGAAYWGDILEPAVEMAERSDVQYMGFDHLSELTMAILNRLKQKNPDAGYIPDIIECMRRILPIAMKRGIRLITNAGGANPKAAALAVKALAEELGVGPLKIGVVYGDDILHKIPAMHEQGVNFQNMDTGEVGLDRIRGRLVAANVYTGSEKIIEQLAAGADVVICGRVSDNALFVAPIMHEFGWDYSPQYTDRIAAAITTGHVIECSACVTGGMSNMWRVSERPWEIGFPIAEFYENGDAIITKTPDSGGVVNEWTVKEHLLYEIQNPAQYIMPDGVADFTALSLVDEGSNRVRLSGMKGHARPTYAKACLGYSDGFIAEGSVYFPWPDAFEKAQFAVRWMEERLKALELPLLDLQIDYIGVNMLHGDAAPQRADGVNEVGVRIAARAESRKAAQAIRREVTHLWTMGPIGAAVGVPTKVRPVVSLWPTLVPWDVVDQHSEQIEVGG